MAQFVVTICGLPPEVWERCKARVGKDKSNSEVGRQIVLEWLETIPGAAKYQKPDEPQEAAILEAVQSSAPMKHPVVYTWERPA